MSTTRDGREVPPGLAYLLRHGHAADGGHGANREPTQHLVNPPVHNPGGSEAVHAWIRRRALADPHLQAARECP